MLTSRLPLLALTLAFLPGVFMPATAADLSEHGGSAVTVVEPLDQTVASLVLPQTLEEGQGLPNSVNAAVVLNHAAQKAMTFRLTSAPRGELALPAVVTVPKGSSGVGFRVRAINDRRQDGDLAVTVTATGSGAARTLAPATGVITTIDDDEVKSVALSLDLPETLLEGAKATGSLTLSKVQLKPVQVTLSAPPSLSVPAKVTIPVGAISASFPISAIDNTLRDGSRTVIVDARASLASLRASATLTIRDNEVTSYRLGSLGDIVNLSASVKVSFSVYDVEGNAIDSLPPGLSFALKLPDGSVQSLPAASFTEIQQASFSGSLILPAIAAAPLKLVVSDSTGGAGESALFDTMRSLPLSLPAADLVWDSIHSRILASVPRTSNSPHAGEVVAVDPVTLQVTGSVATGQDPGKLALTSGAEYVYAAMNDNGTIIQIRPADMSIVSTFAVGQAADFSNRTLFVRDMETVAGQPDLTVVSRLVKNVSPSYYGVAVYDHGVARPVTTSMFQGIDVIESSPDPTVFYGLDNETSGFSFYHLKIDASGITVTGATEDIVEYYNADMRSGGGSQIVTGIGDLIDANQSKVTGNLGARGLPVPVPAEHRIYFLEPFDPASYRYDRISAYDPGSGARVASEVLPAVINDAFVTDSLIRCGKSGFAFHSGNSLVLLSASQLIPSQAPADLAVSVDAPAMPPVTGQPFVYTVHVTNNAPNPAAQAVISAGLSAGQTLVSAIAADGTGTAAQISGGKVSFSAGTLSPGSSSTLLVTATSTAAGRFSLQAAVSSLATDPDFSNNSFTREINVGFQSAADSVNRVRLDANNLVYDPVHRVLWATVRDMPLAPYGRSLVSIDPTTGHVSDPEPLLGTASDRVMSLSPNGRYLYVGLATDTALQRFDLSVSPPASLRIPLPKTDWGGSNNAVDIAVLDGDGTSFMVTSGDEHSASVYDGTVMRPDQTGIYSVDVMMRTPTPGIFVGYCNSISDFRMSRLQVTPTGVKVLGSISTDQLFNTVFDSDGDLLVSSIGSVIDEDTFYPVCQLGSRGRPLADRSTGRAYLVSGAGIRAYDAKSGAGLGSFTLSPSLASAGDWAVKCVRWGDDGFAATGEDGNVYIARWSPGASGGSDANALAYFFGVDPVPGPEAAPPGPQCRLEQAGDQTRLVLSFPRRAWVTAGTYHYETSTDLIQWTVTQDFTESVRSGPTTPGGIRTEAVEVSFPASGGSQRFVRLVLDQP